MFVYDACEKVFCVFSSACDDFAVFHNNDSLCENVYAKLSAKMKMKRGELNYFLGMRVRHYDDDDGSYSLDQEKHALSVVKERR